VEELTEALK